MAVDSTTPFLTPPEEVGTSGARRVDARVEGRRAVGVGDLAFRELRGRTAILDSVEGAGPTRRVEEVDGAAGLFRRAADGGAAFARRFSGLGGGPEIAAVET
jgi:hypothetical protein